MKITRFASYIRKQENKDSLFIQGMFQLIVGGYESHQACWDYLESLFMVEGE
jgi:hypothetical protein